MPQPESQRAGELLKFLASCRCQSTEHAAAATENPMPPLTAQARSPSRTARAMPIQVVTNEVRESATTAAQVALTT